VPDVTAKARYIMIGGFLGAGKTTAVLALAKILRDRGQRVGLITNDQSHGLVDTTMLASHGFDVEEITGGCFCCKFNSLVDASQKLSSQTKPDVFLAEPVGSCTDLKATVDYPLRRIYGNDFAVAPLSVMLDPTRAARILGLADGSSFSKKVVYIYRKQLEEAEIIVVNKIDLLSPNKLDELLQALQREYPQAHVIPVSAKKGSGVFDWLKAIESGVARTDGAMSVDYETYAEGEALLGWTNAAISVEADGEVDGNALLLDIGQRLHQRIAADGAEIAHLKLTLTPGKGNDLAVANLVRSDGSVEFSHRLQSSITDGELLVNLRAEADPDLLRRYLLDVVGATSTSGVRLTVLHLESFRPGKPTPTHRLAGV
jgi:G3E family GTPase